MSLKTNNFLYEYLSDNISFRSSKAKDFLKIYMPLCGATADSLKSAITPTLGGDIKSDKEHYLTRPVSTEDLRYGLRNFFVWREGQGVSCLTDRAQEHDYSVEIGQLWHKVLNHQKGKGLSFESLNFIPASSEQCELMRVSVKNISDKSITLTPTASIPLFARALSNKHDHEHVTSLLHRVQQSEYGVLVEPSMTFDEQGHQPSTSVYYVLGVSDAGEIPAGTFPTTVSFLGDGSTLASPQAVLNNESPVLLGATELNGKEAMGALRFKEVTLAPGESRAYFIVMGIAGSLREAQKVFQSYGSDKKFNTALEANQRYWAEKSYSIQFQTGDEDYNAWLGWVTIQPVLRRIFGCSFLPDHDYGKGGKGWRDIWQDLLSLILIEPQSVRDTLVNNFAGVRIDGSNATIIGSAPGEFAADRNAITRVWMDHGAWPLETIALYINQTGDFDILLEESTYFKDLQLSRTFKKDTQWKSSEEPRLKTGRGDVYRGSIIEHILVQHLTQFFNVGEHNISRLESADWNDGLDMAFDRGESTAFMSFYGGNLSVIADLLEHLAEKKGMRYIEIYKELAILLDSIGDDACDYDDVAKKKDRFFKHYCPSVEPVIIGETVKVGIKDIVQDLRRKSEWIFKHIRSQEWVTVKDEEMTYGWFNGYYDNRGERVEGRKDDRIWMTLTGQVFPIMSGLAGKDKTNFMIESVNRFLKDDILCGVRLNTDFGVNNYLELGRAFGFAYGTKENGAFFSHMIVMYAYALYKQGFAREGHRVLSSIYAMCMDTDKSKIYPGVPEYFDSEGRGMYHYLTGSASWWILTELTQVFGARGLAGDLLLNPKLVKEQFTLNGRASVDCYFADKRISVVYDNPLRLDFGEYTIERVDINGTSIEFDVVEPGGVKINRGIIRSQKKQTVTLRVTLNTNPRPM